MTISTGFPLLVVAASMLLAPFPTAYALQSEVPEESDYYEIIDIPQPDGVVLEVSGLMTLPDGRPMLSTRRGEVFIVENAYGKSEEAPTFKLFAQGLQEPLGMLWKDGWIYISQRSELSRMRDENGDDRVDVIETVNDEWVISGNYHEYCFGPRLDLEGNLWLTLNKPFGGEPFGKVDWRGWAIKITPDGKFVPAVCGLRSPAGVHCSPDGDMFYTDNQGEWCGANKLSHMVEGEFHGHPHGIASAKREDSPLPFPGDPPNGELMPEVAKKMPTFKLPAVWFPYEKMGKSASGMVWDTTEGKFGPFAGQVLVGDQHHSCLNRVFLEKVGGHWQGACFPFRYGFASGVLRVAWGKDQSLLVGLTNRGWGSRGGNTKGLQRLKWNGKMPFEVREMLVRPDGFELRFTQPVDAATVEDLASYKALSYTYKLHSTYGSPEVDKKDISVTKARVSDDRMSAMLFVDDLREGYVHEFIMKGIRSAEGLPLLHPDAYYTLINLPVAAAGGE